MKKNFVLFFFLISVNLFAVNNPDFIITHDDDSRLYSIYNDGFYQIRVSTSTYSRINENYVNDVIVYEKGKIINNFESLNQTSYLVPEYHKFYFLNYEEYYDNGKIYYFDYQSNEIKPLTSNNKKISIIGKRFFLSEDKKQLYFLKNSDDANSSSCYFCVYNLDEETIVNEYPVKKNEDELIITWGMVSKNTFSFICVNNSDELYLSFYKFDGKAIRFFKKFCFSEDDDLMNYESDEIEFINVAGGNSVFVTPNIFKAQTKIYSYEGGRIVNNTGKLEGTLLCVVYNDDEDYLVTVQFADDCGIIRIYDRDLNLLEEKTDEVGSENNNFHIEEIGFNKETKFQIEYISNK